jgi:hypothetical protein
LDVLHALDVVFQGVPLFAAVNAGLEAQELRQFGPVAGVFDEAQLDVLAEGFPELEVLVLHLLVLGFVLAGRFR